MGRLFYAPEPFDPPVSSANSGISEKFPPSQELQKNEQLFHVKQFGGGSGGRRGVGARGGRAESRKDERTGMAGGLPRGPSRIHRFEGKVLRASDSCMIAKSYGK